MKKKSLIVVYAVLIIFLFIVGGTCYFKFAEGWSWINAFYFVAMTISTVGYGDLTPTSDLAKIVTSIFSLTGIPLALFSFGIIAEHYFEKRIEDILETRDQIKQRIDD